MRTIIGITILGILLNLMACQSNLRVEEKALNVQAYQEHSPTAHHQIALEVLKTSKAWIKAFNKGNIKDCVEGYANDAILNATPLGRNKGKEEIINFWQSLIHSGAANLIYTNVKIEVVNDSTSFLSADWSMNIGHGKIYQEKWEKKAGKWKLTLDDFEVLEQFKEPKENTNDPIAAHVLLETFIHRSINWIKGFNQQNSASCGAAYVQNAIMNAVPFANLSDKETIQGFWKELINNGAKNLIYHNPTFELLTPNTAQLSSNWSMNIGEGKIYQEKWLFQNNEWGLAQDEFEMLRQY